jgi:hypothetical protein
MNGMSEREYSTHSGMSRGAIQNAKRGARLVFYADGSINGAARLAAMQPCQPTAAAGQTAI